MAVPDPIEAHERAAAVRDLHDLVMHRVTEIRVNAAALGTVMPEAGRATLDAVLASSAEALKDLRAMHRLIDADQTVSYTVTPGLESLQDLLDAERPARFADVRHADVPAGVAAAAYRLTQEVLRVLHTRADVHLHTARLAAVGQRLELELDLDCDGLAEPLDLRRAQVRARLSAGTVACFGGEGRCTVAIVLPFEVSA